MDVLRFIRAIEGPTALPLRTRLHVVLVSTLFVAAFKWLYVTHLHPVWGYYGFGFVRAPLEFEAAAWILAIAPSLWAPAGIERPSQLVFWVLYLLVYIPSLFTPLYANLRPPGEVFGLMLALFGGIAVVSTAWLGPTLRLGNPGSRSRIFWTAFALVWLVLVVWIAIVFRNRFRFASLGDVFETRFEGGDIIVSEAGVGYAVMWLSGSLNPFLMAWGLVHKRVGLFAVGALGQLLCYGTAANRIMILSVAILPLLYLVLRDPRSFGLRLTWAVLLITLGCNAIFLLSQEIAPGGALSILLGVVVMRTLAIPGLLTAQYHDFFRDHPWTWYSHVTGVNRFVEYPYSHELGLEVGFFYYGSVDLNANAHFWCTDGLAAAGWGGILVSSILLAVVLRVLDSAAERQNAVLSALALTMSAANLSNCSLFTSLLSGGLGLTMLLLYFAPTDDRVRLWEALRDWVRRRRGSLPAVGYTQRS